MDFIEDQRKVIDDLDAEIIRLLAERMKASKSIGDAKRSGSKPVYAPGREAAVLQRRRELARQHGIDPFFVDRLYTQEIIPESRWLQRHPEEEQLMVKETKKTVLTGMRPTGALHLGHYVGALRNWLKVQHENECYFLIADYQALSDHADDVAGIRQSVMDVAMDWLAVGLDPDLSAFCIQSLIPEHAELTMLLSFITSMSVLDRNPTLKSELRDLEERSTMVTVGFMTYPVSQIADILLPRAHLVPVGEDQLPHIEDTRHIARRFNKMYGEVFPIPVARVGDVGRLVGIDGGKKMGKSLRNVIELRASEDEVRKLVMKMYTDPNRIHSTDPGTVEGNPLFIYHRAFNPDKDEVDDLEERYRTGRVGDVEVKEKLAAALNEFLGPIREKRAYYEARPNLVKDALIAGTDRERVLAKETLRMVKDAMGIASYFD